MEKTEINISFIHIYLLPSKGAYFALYGSVGALLPYINLYYMSSSLTVQQAGIITGIRYFFAAIAMVLFGILADYLRNKKRLLLILIVLASSIIFVIPWMTYGIRKTDDIQRVNALDGNNSCKDWHTEANKTIQHEAFVTLVNSSTFGNRKCDPISETLEFSNSNNKLFFSVLAVSCLYSIGAIPVNGFIDALVIQEVNARKAVYGHQRVFCPIGFMVFSFISGVAVDSFPESTYMSKYTAIFLVLLPTCVIMFISVYVHNSHEVRRETKPRPWKFILRHCKKLNIIMLFLTIFHCGLANFTVIGYLGVLLEEIGSSKTVIGVIVASSALAELITFFFSDKLKKLFRGTFICFTLATTSYCIRCMLFSFLKNPFLYIPTQLLQAFGFALFWAVTVEYVEKTSPPEIRMTMFNLMHLCYFSAGGITASVGGGTIYKYYGGRKLFMVVSIACGVWSLILVLYNLLRGNKTTQKKEKELHLLL